MVKPASIFPSIVTLRGVTQEELVLTVKTLLACKSYGAESRIGGDCRNTFFGVVAGWEELITPLEFTLELYDQRERLDADAMRSVLEQKYKALAGNPERIRVLPATEVDAIVQECARTPVDKTFLDKAYNDIAEYRKAQA